MGYIQLGKETRDELKDLYLLKAVIVRHIRHVYSCRNCEKTSDHNFHCKGRLYPEPVIKGSFASPEDNCPYSYQQKIHDGVSLISSGAGMETKWH
nr:hypothetical protein [Acetivibrio clariflavus]